MKLESLSVLCLVTISVLISGEIILAEPLAGSPYSQKFIANSGFLNLPMAYTHPGVGESGAIFPVGKRYYGMFGEGRSMRSFVADKFSGPYVESEKYKVFLNKGPTYFSRFLPTEDGLLVNHHAMSGAGVHHGRWLAITYASPFKRAVVDEEGVMRWMYWEGNDAIKGDPVAVAARRDAPLNAIAEPLDLNRGVVMEADIALSGADESTASLAFAVGDNHYAVRFLPDGGVEMGNIDSTGNNWQKKFGVNRETSFGDHAKVRILVRAGMMEVYLDDHFMECWTMGCYGAPSIQVLLPLRNRVEEVRLWRMSLEPATTTHAPEPKDVVVADFEGNDFDGWSVEGQAFGAGPSRPGRDGQPPHVGLEGKGFANSHSANKGDAAVGRLVSPVFQMKRRHLSLLVGGGNFPETVSVSLIVANKTVATITGSGTPRLSRQTINTEPWVGDSAKIAITDAESDPQGYVVVDDIVQTNAPEGR